jgi:glycosyltransferase involved in cell wall biosynthesis
VSRSLSLVLPVCNAERTLAENVQHLFEILNDLTDRFEVLLVDQGSIDHTIDVAQDLAIQYPQVRLARRETVDREDPSLDRTLAETTGDIVFVQRGHAGVRPSALRQLWELNDNASAPEANRITTKKLSRSPSKDETQTPRAEIEGLTMICRSHPANRRY